MRGNKSIEIERAIESGHAREAVEALIGSPSRSLRLSALLAPSLTPILELFLDYLACLSEDSCCTANIWFVFRFVGSCQAQATHRLSILRSLCYPTSSRNQPLYKLGYALHFLA